jgi:hypothetical protein
MMPEGGPLELIGAYGKLILAVIFVIFLVLMFITYINSHPELGISVPGLFGG